MYISKVQIKNFRNLEDAEVRLGEKVVLLGENSAGKSNFIEALRILLDSNYRPMLGESDFPRGQKAFRGNTIKIRAWFSGIDPAKDEYLPAVLHDCHGEEENTYLITAVYKPRKNDDPEKATTADDYELVRYGGTNPDNTDGDKSLRQYVRLVTIPAVRDLERDMQSWRTSPLRRLVEMINLTDESSFQKIAENVKKESENLQKIPPIDQLQKEIRDLLGELVEGQAIQPTIGIAAANPEDLLRLLTILVEENLPIDHSSLGVSNVLYLLTWLLYAQRLRNMPAKNDQHPEHILLAIEEPEAHLHPHFQRLIFENLFKDGGGKKDGGGGEEEKQEKQEKQEHLLLVSTHSPTIVSVANPRHFVVLKRTDAGTKAFSTACFASPADRAKESEGEECEAQKSERTFLEPEKMFQDIRRFLDATRGEVVFSRGVLLVEGDAEMFLIPAFAKKMKEAKKISHTLDGAGISVCNVYGTDFRPYVEFLGPKNLDLPIAILTDGDPPKTNQSFDDDESDGEQPEFAGLKRGLELARLLQAPNLADLAQKHEQQAWVDVRAGLEENGIFVNEQTLEVELLKAGYKDEFCTVYAELGASEKQVRNLREAIERQEFDFVIRRIETTGMGKGRFAQRLAGKLDANRVPPYIEKAIRYILEKTPQSIYAAPVASVPDDMPESPENDIPF